MRKIQREKPIKIDENLAEIVDIFDHHVDWYLSTTNPGNAIDVAQEECAEFIQALSKSKRGKEHSRKMVVEEAAHVLISTIAICKIYKISVFEILRELMKKEKL